MAFADSQLLKQQWLADVNTYLSLSVRSDAREDNDAGEKEVVEAVDVVKLCQVCGSCFGLIRRRHQCQRWCVL